MSQHKNTRVAIVGGIRTPFAKAGTAFKKHSPLALSTHALNGLLDSLDLDPELVDELAHGIVILDPRTPHLAKELVFASKLPSKVTALTVTDNCITGTSAITTLYDSISTGRIEVAIAGGVESMSNPALLFSQKASRIFLDANAAKSIPQKLGRFLKLRPGDFIPAAPAIAEPSTGLSMGEHTELMVKQWKISQQEQDEIAYHSHINAYQATEDGRLTSEIVPLDGHDHDLIIRPDTTKERLASLSPVFDRSPAGTLTAGNSSPLTDGAAMIVLMSEQRALDEGYEPLAFIKAIEKVAIDPEDGLLMGPGVAVPRVLRKAGLTLNDIDLIEMHEAFGGQIACNLKAWEQGWKEPAIGTVDRGKLNQLGGSIAIGHPFAATGIRIATTLANEMKRQDARYGLISICAAGAQASAMILERN